MAVAAIPVSGRSQSLQQIAGIYSDLAYNQESGDLNGVELFIVPSEGAKAYVAFVQEAEGVPANPVVAPVVRKGDRISISVKFFGDVWKFEGKIGKTAFDGTLTIGTGKPEQIHLRRKKSYWEGP